MSSIDYLVELFTLNKFDFLVKNMGQTLKKMFEDQKHPPLCPYFLAWYVTLSLFSNGFEPNTKQIRRALIFSSSIAMVSKHDHASYTEGVTSTSFCCMKWLGKYHSL